MDPVRDTVGFVELEPYHSKDPSRMIIHNNLTQEVKITADQDKELTISCRDRKKLPPFRAIGKGETTMSFESNAPITTIDPFKEIVEEGGVMTFAMMTALLISKIDYRTNISILVPKDQSEANAFSKWYKRLRARNMAVRIKPRTYLVNPYMVYPLTPNRDLVIAEWMKYTSEK